MQCYVRADLEIVQALDRFENRLEQLKLWQVKFIKKMTLKWGEKLYIVGDCESLGDSDPQHAVPMTHSLNDRWMMTALNVPEGTRYRYFVRKEHCEPKFLTEYWVELNSSLDQCRLVDGALECDDSFHYVRFRVSRDDAEQVYITGSLEELGNWDRVKALPLLRVRGTNVWEGVVKISADVMRDFEYKFFERPTNWQKKLADDTSNKKHVEEGIRFEAGPNRISDVHLVEPQRELEANGVDLGHQRIANLDCVWEGLVVRFIIYHPLDTPGAVLACSGSHQALGAWLGEPRRMALGDERTLLTGVKGRCWETTWAGTHEDCHNLQYRYCIIDPKGSGVFEREPNRVISMLPGTARTTLSAHASLGIAASVQNTNDKPFRQREWQTYDGNFVPPNLSYDDVPPCLAIGPYPQSKADVELMKANGVTGVLNVQTDFDHERRMIDWNQMLKSYKEADLQVTRVPIEDFNGDDLARLVKEAARAVDKMVRDAEGKGRKPKIYIHCTAGMGRAPAVACVYLVWKHRFSLHDALAHCKRHRAVCAPNWHAMESALRHGGF